MPKWNTIRCGDCIEGMDSYPAGSADLVFADPPFNIGYDYDVYRDRLARDEYLEWSRQWIAAVHRLLKPDGTFWLAIGDEYAAELKLASQEIGFHPRGWVIWYYTFGVNCDRKFTRSHAHLFYFVKDPKQFTFREDDLENRIPSARQLVYADKRANPRGRLPDDTWIIRPASATGRIDVDDADETWTLRPQDLSECFTATEDTWYFPRVAGTFKERAGFHGCQMPEQLLGRIVRTCSNDGDTVVDPFSGSATTVAVAKKLGRRYLAFDLSHEYVELGLARLASIRSGDRLDGSAEPTMSAPSTESKQLRSAKRASQKRGGRNSPVAETSGDHDRHLDARQLELTLTQILQAFGRTYDGFSADRLVADPQLNECFVGACRQKNLVGDPRSWNTLLFRLRKQGRLELFPATRSTSITWEDCDRYLFASEVALQRMLAAGEAESLDEILCDPVLANQFDETAREFAPGFTSLEYRWAALKLRKQARRARSQGQVLSPPSKLKRGFPLGELPGRSVPEAPGVYLLSGGESSRVYAGEALNLRHRLSAQFEGGRLGAWNECAPDLKIQFHPIEPSSATMLAWQSCLVQKFKPRMNYRELSAAR